MATCTNFCCRSGGSNLNAGTRTGDTTEPGTSADLTYAAGSWVAGTGVFTVASGDPVADGVAVGDFASVYADGSTVTGFVGRVTGRTTTTITVSLTAKAGTAPTDGTSNRTLKIGGAWAGPSGTTAFPFVSSFDLGGLQNASGHLCRVNVKNDTTYAVTAGLTPVSGSFYAVIQGYGSSFGDGGRATISGGSSGTSYQLVAVASLIQMFDLIFDGNGGTGSATLVNADDSRVVFDNCVFKNSRGNGLGGGALVSECEAFACNVNNTANLSGFTSSNVRTVYIRCISHDNTGSNARGFYHTNSGAVYINCIAHANGNDGFHSINSATCAYVGCDAYDNGGDGFESSGSNNIALIENSNFVSNGGYGLRLVSTAPGVFKNIRYGAGTQANTSGTSVNNTSSHEHDVSSYANDVTPWTDPDNGDFRISLAAAQNSGRGDFLQTDTGYSGTVGYPDIGAAQAQSTGGGGGARMVNIRGGADQ